MTKNKTLDRWNIGMSAVQAVMGAVLLYIYSDENLLNKSVKLTTSGVVKIPTSSNESELGWIQKDGSNVYIAREVVAFFFVTSLFHGTYALMGKKYHSMIDSGNNCLRWIEYSISATLMIRIIALQAGVRDQSTLELITANTIGIMLQGQIVEAILAKNKKQLNKFQKSAILTATIVGWLLMVANFYVIMKQYLSLVDDVDKFNCPDVKVPDFVVYIIGTQLFFYATFGFIQIYQVYQRLENKKVDYSQIELLYLIDSLASKVTLGALLGYSVTSADKGAYGTFKC